MKQLNKFVVMFIAVSVITAMGVWTLLTLVELTLVMFGKDFNTELLSYCLLALPLVLYTWVSLLTGDASYAFHRILKALTQAE